MDRGVRIACALAHSICALSYQSNQGFYHIDGLGYAGTAAANGASADCPLAQ